jgi:hypothetical protein
MVDALAWSRRWLGIDDHKKTEHRRPVTWSSPPSPHQRDDVPSTDRPDHWRRPWQSARPITNTLAETYLTGRRLRFEDPDGRVLRFAERHARKNPAGDLEHNPAVLAALSDVRTGERCGTINIYLRADGTDRLRDSKSKTTWGRAQGAAVMLSGFDEPTYGLTICEGVETGIALLMADLAPVWCSGGAGNLTTFPVLDGIEALTIAADADEPGQRAATAAADRWCAAGLDAVIVTPPVGDWADARRG